MFISKENYNKLGWVIERLKDEYIRASVNNDRMSFDPGTFENPIKFLIKTFYEIGDYDFDKVEMEILKRKTNIASREIKRLQKEAGFENGRKIVHVDTKRDARMASDEHDNGTVDDE